MLIKNEPKEYAEEYNYRARHHAVFSIIICVFLPVTVFIVIGSETCFLWQHVDGTNLKHAVDISYQFRRVIHITRCRITPMHDSNFLPYRTLICPSDVAGHVADTRRRMTM